jgi:putative endonuclease
VAVAGADFASRAGVPHRAKRFVYIIRSVNHPDRRYVGVSADVPARLGAHNAGQNRSTAPWRPWFIDVCVVFRTERVAMRFETFLKSGAGHAFAKRHFVDAG